MFLPWISFGWSMGAIKKMNEPSLQETETDISGPRIPVPFDEGFNIFDAHVVFNANHGRQEREHERLNVARADTEKMQVEIGVDDSASGYMRVGVSVAKTAGSFTTCRY